MLGVVTAVAALASCAGEADEPEQQAEPAACGFVDDAT